MKTDQKNILHHGFIDGVFNYCDRWCERCPLTSRCQLFAEEQRSPRDPAVHDLASAAFWRELERKLGQAMDMIAAESRARGITLDDDELADAGRTLEARWTEVERQPTTSRARAYRDKADEWLKTNEARLAEAQDRLDRVGEAVEVIRWYLLPIQTKLMRALHTDDEAGERSDPGSDANGSAKVALIGVNRSIAAWSVLFESVPAERDEILDLLVALDRLRRLVEAEFPRARSFVRPGFDTP